MALAAEVRWSFRGKDAGSARTQRYGRDRGRSLGASSATQRHRRFRQALLGAVTGRRKGYPVEKEREVFT